MKTSVGYVGPVHDGGELMPHAVDQVHVRDTAGLPHHGGSRCLLVSVVDRVGEGRVGLDVADHTGDAAGAGLVDEDLAQEVGDAV